MLGLLYPRLLDWANNECNIAMHFMKYIVQNCLDPDICTLTYAFDALCLLSNNYVFTTGSIHFFSHPPTVYNERYSIGLCAIKMRDIYTAFAFLLKAMETHPRNLFFSSRRASMTVSLGVSALAEVAFLNLTVRLRP